VIAAGKRQDIDRRSIIALHPLRRGRRH
jgi:hypothetical protein